MEHQRHGLPYTISAYWLLPRLAIIPLSLLTLLSAAPPLVYADSVSSNDPPPATGSTPPEPEYLILDVYESRGEAEDRAARERRQGGDVRMRAEQVYVTQDNLRLGVYRDFAMAADVVNNLHRHGIKSRIIGSADKGYGVSIGVFSDADNAERMRERLGSLGFDNVKLTPFEVLRTRYVVEK